MKKYFLLIVCLSLSLSCSGDGEEDLEFVPGDVLVGIKSGVETEVIFDFINDFSVQVERMNLMTFTSRLPSDSLQYVLDYLNEKPYTNDGESWFVTGYLHYQTEEITIFPKFFGIENEAYQTDWLESMAALRLVEKFNPDLSSASIFFKVPEGSEIIFRDLFLNYEIVDWAELNYIREISLD